MKKYYLCFSLFIFSNVLFASDISSISGRESEYEETCLSGIANSSLWTSLCARIQSFCTSVHADCPSYRSVPSQHVDLEYINGMDDTQRRWFLLTRVLMLVGMVTPHASLKPDPAIEPHKENPCCLVNTNGETSCSEAFCSIDTSATQNWMLYPTLICYGAKAFGQLSFNLWMWAHSRWTRYPLIGGIGFFAAYSTIQWLVDPKQLEKEPSRSGLAFFQRAHSSDFYERFSSGTIQSCEGPSIGANWDGAHARLEFVSSSCDHYIFESRPNIGGLQGRRKHWDHDGYYYQLALTDDEEEQMKNWLVTFDQQGMDWDVFESNCIDFVFKSFQVVGKELCLLSDFAQSHRGTGPLKAWFLKTLLTEKITYPHSWSECTPLDTEKRVYIFQSLVGEVISPLYFGGMCLDLYERVLLMMAKKSDWLKKSSAK